MTIRTGKITKEIIRTGKITKESTWKITKEIIRTGKITNQIIRTGKITKENTWKPRDLGHSGEAVGRRVIAGGFSFFGCCCINRWTCFSRFQDFKILQSCFAINFQIFWQKHNFSPRLSSDSKGGVSGSSVSLTTPQVKKLLISWTLSKRSL